jgi:hypothetical protein
VPAQTQRTRVQRLSPKSKRGLCYRSLQVGYRSKKQSLTHMWLHATLLAPSSPSAMWSSSHLDSLSCISLLCHPFPLATLSECRLDCFFSGPSYCIVMDFLSSLILLTPYWNLLSTTSSHCSSSSITLSCVRLTNIALY